MKLILLGAPGSGKGTMAEKLSQEFNLQHLSTGEIFRAEMSKKTQLGMKAQELINQGKLVPDEITINMLKPKIAGKDDYLLDGFPRTIPQAEAIADQKIDAVIYLKISEAAVIERLSGRRICSQCQTGYHLKYVPPKKSGVCDHCNGKLIQRVDDAPEAVQKRFREFNEKTQPLVDYYSKRGLLQTIDAAKSPDQVYAQVWKVVQKLD